MYNAPTMSLTRRQTLDVLAAHRPQLRAMGIRSLALFGSVAKDEATEDSDVDLLVEFDRPIGLFGLQDVRDHLTNLLGYPVDLVPRSSLKRQLRQRILAEAVDAA